MKYDVSERYDILQFIVSLNLQFLFYLLAIFQYDFHYNILWYIFLNMRLILQRQLFTKGFLSNNSLKFVKSFCAIPAVYHCFLIVMTVLYYVAFMQSSSGTFHSAVSWIEWVRHLSLKFSRSSHAIWWNEFVVR